MHLLTRVSPTNNLCEHKSSLKWIKRIDFYLYVYGMRPTKFHNFQTKPVGRGIRNQRTLEEHSVYMIYKTWVPYVHNKIIFSV